MENSEILGLPELATETTPLAVHMKNASYTYPSRAFSKGFCARKFMLLRLPGPLFQRGCRTGAEGQKCIIEEGSRCGETRELSHSILGVFFRETGRPMCCINAR